MLSTVLPLQIKQTFKAYTINRRRKISSKQKIVEGELKIVRGKSNLLLQVRELQLIALFSGLTVSVEGGGDGIDILLAAINK